MPEIKTLPNMNSSMLEKADELLESKQIQTNVGLRLIIEMMAEEFRALNAIIDNQNTQNEVIRQQGRAITELQQKSIVLFIEKNPRTTLAVIAVAIALSKGYDVWNWLLSFFNIPFP